jgi:hypothetical protein
MNGRALDFPALHGGHIGSFELRMAGRMWELDGLLATAEAPAALAVAIEVGAGAGVFDHVMLARITIDIDSRLHAMRMNSQFVSRLAVEQEIVVTCFRYDKLVRISANVYVGYRANCEYG